MLMTLGLLEEPGNLRHAFFTREGGVSRGIYASLNAGFGSGDDPSNVARNRAIAMAALGLRPEALVTAYQVHGAEVAVVERPWPREGAPRADGLVTARPGLALGVLTADCVPVLLADPQARVIGAAHAGWRGAKAGIVAAVVERMCALGARRERIVAGVGPAIARPSYEVGPEFPELILGRPRVAESAAAEGPDDRDLFAPGPRPGHYLFDLPGYVLRRLATAGVACADRLACDTFREADRFYSYRRAALMGEPGYGRCLSAIVLRP